MLRKSSDKVRDCYARAHEARKRALMSRDPKDRARFFEMEDHWIALAQSCALVETLAEFKQDQRHMLDED
jgi:hypothetical protein